MRALIVFTLLLSLANSSTAHADITTAYDWLTDVTGDDSSKKLLAAGYLKGAADTMMMFGACLANVQYGVMGNVAVAFIKAHPTKQHMPAIKAFAVAWDEAWPCPPEKKTTSPAR